MLFGCWGAVTHEQGLFCSGLGAWGFELGEGLSMNRMVVALLVVILGFGLFLVVQDTEETDSNEIARAEELATEMNQGEATDNSAVDTQARGLRDKQAKSREVQKSRYAQRKAEEKERLRREGRERVADLGYSAYDVDRIAKAWEDAQDAMESCRSEIKKEEGGELDFRAMKACDRSHLDALYEDFGNPDDYRAALVAANRMIRVEVGIVDEGGYAYSLGLEEGDQLISWDGRPIFEPDDWRIPQQRLVDSEAPIIMEFLKPTGEVYQVESPGGRTGASMRGYR